MATTRMLLRLLSVAAICAPAAPVFGQARFEAADQGQAINPDIVVTAKTEAQREDVSRQAKDTAQPSGNPHRNPLARFEKPVCPGVMGMPAELAEHLVGRIRYVAQEAGLSLAPELTCSVNMLVIVVPDTAEGLRQAERAWPVMFENMTLAEKRRLRETSDPIRVITLKSERTRDGFVIPPDRGGSPPVVSVPLAFSKIYLTTREDIEGVIILVEPRAVGGLSIVQMADYVAMRGFAETQTPTGDILAMDTILTLFVPGAAKPPAITQFDRAYLRSVYDGLPNMPAISKTLGVNRQLKKIGAEDPTGR